MALDGVLCILFLQGGEYELLPSCESFLPRLRVSLQLIRTIPGTLNTGKERKEGREGGREEMKISPTGLDQKLRL